MNKSQSQTSVQKVYSESSKLNPSTKITFFEIDITDLALDMSIVTDGEVSSDPDGNIIRLHNNYKLFSKNLVWQGNVYNVAPIAEDGFEINSVGKAPTPKISISIEENSGAEPILGKLRNKIDDINGLIGAKLTKKTTFLKHLDSENFLDMGFPQDYDEDSNAHFPDEVFYFERKTKESKNVIEFELSSLLDFKNTKLPNRIVSANRCPFCYRGAGCLYEYNSRRVTAEHGNTSESTLPDAAPSVANDRDERILDILKNLSGYTTYTSIKDRGKWQKGITYSMGDQVYIIRGNIKYYFVAKQSALDKAPPSKDFWIADNCSKSIKGCNLRWGGKNFGYLRYGGFPSVAQKS